MNGEVRVSQVCIYLGSVLLCNKCAFGIIWTINNFFALKYIFINLAMCFPSMLELLLFEHAVNFREVEATFCLILHQVIFLCGS